VIEEVQAGVADSGGVYFQPSTSQHGGSHDSEFDAVIRSCATRLSKRFVSMHATSSFILIHLSVSRAYRRGRDAPPQPVYLFTRVSDGPTWTSSAI
jgi:hypothetical protein